MMELKPTLVFAVIAALAGVAAADVSNPADINSDGKIDLVDLALLTDNWLWVRSTDDMLPIPAGEFEMGDHSGIGERGELPVHTVRLDAFYMGKYEITNHLYCDFLNSADVTVFQSMVFASSDIGHNYPYLDTYAGNPACQIAYDNGTFTVVRADEIDMADHPVATATWYGAAAYCNQRSLREGLDPCYDLSTWQCDFTKNGYRLPTEAQWEYAARGGYLETYYRYPWGSDAIDGDMANYDRHNPLGLSSYPYTTPAGHYPGHGYGLSDIAGNVWEWCNDWYDAAYYSDSPVNNPAGPTTGTWRVLRGGSWVSSGQICRVAYRGRSTPAERYYAFGFRVVLNQN